METTIGVWGLEGMEGNEQKWKLLWGLGFRRTGKEHGNYCRVQGLGHFKEWKRKGKLL